MEKDIIISPRGYEHIMAICPDFDCKIKAVSRFCGEFRVKLFGYLEDIEQMFNAHLQWIIGKRN